MKADPWHEEAEEYVLGAAMLNNAAADKVFEILEPDGDAKFYRASHGLVYRAVRGLHAAKRPTDVVSVVALLENKGVLKDAGGKERLKEIATLVPAATAAPHHAKLILDAYRRRVVIAGLRTALEQAEGEPDPMLVLATAERAASDLRAQIERNVESASWTGWEASQYVETLLQPRDHTEEIAGPFPFIQRMQKGDLYVLSGYSSDGKTALAGQFARSASLAGKRVGFATMEMTRKQLAVRLVTMLGAPARPFRSGQVADGQRAQVNTAIQQLATWQNLDIYDDPTADVPALARYVNRGQFDLLIVDHLHQFRIHNPQYERAELEQIVTDLKRLAGRANIPIVLLAQMSRAGDVRKPFPRPTMSSLKGSGKIEQLASVVWFVWRERDEKQLATDKAEFIIAKNRHGSTGAYDLHFDQSCVRFTPVRQAWQGEPA